MKVKFGPVVGDARRSFEAQTFSRNRFGAYVRHRTAPVQPRTPRQTSGRSLLIEFSSRWRVRSPVERADWDNFGAQIVRTDSLGGTYSLSGHQAYVGMNIARVRAGDPPIDSPLVLRQLPTFQIVTVTISGGGFTALDIVPALPGSGFRYRVWAGGARSAGRRFVRPSDYVLLLIGAENGSVGTATALAALTAAYHARFGVPNPGEFVPVAVDVLDASGLSGNLVRERVIAT